MGIECNDYDADTHTIQQSWCRNKCPVDCQLGEWSQWTPCDNGKKFRKRRIISEAEDGGIPCLNKSKDTHVLDEESC